MSEPIVYRPTQVRELLGISRSSLYRLIGAGELQLIKLGARSSGIPAASLRTFIERRFAAARQAAAKQPVEERRP